MALVKCRECHSDIRSLAAACPKCGAPVVAEAPKAPVAGVPMWQKVVAGALLVAFLYSCIDRANKPASPKAFGVADALILCQDAYRAVVRDPDKAEFPYVPANVSGDEISFSWGAGTRMMRMRNGLGLDVAASGYCAVSKTTKRVTALTLNAETII